VKENLADQPNQILLKVQHLDIYKDEITNKENYHEDEDPAKVSSKKLKKCLAISVQFLI